MNLKEVIEADIVSSGMDGEGVARIGGKVVFIPYALKGERVRAVVTQVKKKYATASVIKVLSPSPHRDVPVCPHFYKCGGCDMGHVTAEYRRDVLVSELKNNLSKIAGLDVSPTDFISSDASGGVRNKLSFPFGTSHGRVVIGLYRHNTHDVEPVDCMLASDGVRSVAKTVCDFANSRKLSAYSEASGSGLLRHLVVREVGGRMSVTLVINADGFDGEEALAQMLPSAADFFVSPNTRKNNVILGETVRLVKGAPRLPVNVLGVRAELSPLSFLQVNDDIRDRLYATALEHISSPTLVDLYSGIGITSNLAAKKCERVIAVECVPQAVADADETAKLNGNADKIKNICGVVESVLPEIASEAKNADVLVDPPRKGCGANVMRGIADVQPNKLIYISCNHATMCRDVRAFLDAASAEYAVTDCKLFDMFPNTHHVETLICLKRKMPK